MKNALRVKLDTSRAPVCVFCQRSGPGIQFNVFSPRFPPFGTACAECEERLPAGTTVPGLQAPATGTRNLPLTLGRVVQTATVTQWVNGDWNRQRAVNAAMARHEWGNWGEVGPEDAQANDDAIGFYNPARVLSSYRVDGQKIWIITEWDRSVTTILFPEEY